MRISELSDITGVSVASIKYYVREGVLPEGENAGYNLRLYSADHVARLRLIRALMESSGLGLSTIRTVIAALEDTETPMPHLMGIAQQAIPQKPGTPSDSALVRVRELMRHSGWATVANNPGITMAAVVLDDMERSGTPASEAQLRNYARAIDQIAAADLDSVEAAYQDACNNSDTAATSDSADGAASKDRADSAEVRARIAQAVVVGITLGDPLLAGLRRIAQESHTHQRYNNGVVPSENSEPS